MTRGTATIMSSLSRHMMLFWHMTICF